ncbi:MAG: hypothetical protein MUC42_10685 [Bryobacter sp.]|nr:hypothetical protein [Bryobacter sp.]
MATFRNPTLHTNATDEATKRITMEIIIIICTVIIALVAILFYWISKIVFILEKSLNEIISGLNSFEERLAKIERNTRKPGAAESMD